MAGAGAALAMESWPARSRGLMSGLLQGSWGLGFLLSSVCYGAFYHTIGWRGLLWIGILPAFVCIYIRFFVKESDVWRENRDHQKSKAKEVRVPLLTIFKPGLIGNTVTACLWMCGQFLVYYSLFSVFAAWLQKDLKFGPGAVATPIALANLVAFFGMGFWGYMADRIGRRRAIMIPLAIGCFVAPIYLFSTDLFWITAGFALQGWFSGAIYALQPAYLNERFPTEVRATAAAFCYHFGSILGGVVPPLLTYLAVERKLGFAMPMLYGTILGALIGIFALLKAPETKGTVFQSDVVVK
jgi:MFS transporter, SHS family, lactate transporter